MKLLIYFIFPTEGKTPFELRRTTVILTLLVNVTVSLASQFYLCIIIYVTSPRLSESHYIFLIKIKCYTMT